MIWWDDSAWYFEQDFQRHGRTVATGFVRAVLRGADGVVTTDTAHAASGISVSRPDMPLIIEVLRQGESELHQLQQTNRNCR